MRLTDLDAKWVMPPRWSSPGLFAIGVTFWCPHCDPALPEHGSDRRRRLALTFWPPIDEDRLREKYGPAWYPKRQGNMDRVSGETFDTLTLSPTINFEGHWGGMIQDGALSAFPAEGSAK